MNKKLLLLLTLMSSAILVLAGCVAQSPVESQAGAGGTVPQPTAETALTPEVLANMTYQSEYGEDGTVTLVDGSYSAPAAPGSASMNTVDLLPEYTVFGDLNGVPSAVVVLVSSGGGSGTFYDLAVVQEEDGQPVNVAAYALGDRIKLNSVAIENNQIVVDMIAAGESDPACCPTHHYVNTYELQGDQIVEINSQMLGVITPEAAAPHSAPLEGPNWQLVSYRNADGEEVAALEDVSAVIRFVDGSVQGNAGCNNFSGAYTVEADQLRVGPMASTMMACPDPIMQQEFGVQDALAETATYGIDQGVLRLYDADGNTLAAFAAVPNAALVGSSWVATGYNNGRGGFTSLIADTEITALFNSEGNLSGTSGCNNYNAAYTAEDGAIEIGPAMTTRMMCSEPEGLMQQEQEYLAALEKAAVYTLGVDTLEIRAADGALVATYTLAATASDNAEVNTPAPAETEGSEELVGPVWQWQGTQYNNDTDATPADPSQVYHSVHGRRLSSHSSRLQSGNGYIHRR